MKLQEYLHYVGEEARDAIQNQLVNDYAVRVSLFHMDMCLGNAYDALVLSQTVFWHSIDKDTRKPRLSYKRDGHLWIVKTHEEWQAELHLSNARTVKEALNRLSKLDYIVKSRHKSPFHDMQVVSHIRLNWPVYLASRNAALNVYSGQPKNGYPEEPKNVYSGQPKNGSSLSSYTTTKTTTKIKDSVSHDTRTPPTQSKSPPSKKQDDKVPKAQFDAMKSALAELFNWHWPNSGARIVMNKGEIGQIQKAAKLLCESNVTPQQAALIYDYCVDKGWDFKPNALPNNVSEAIKWARETGRLQADGTIVRLPVGVDTDRNPAWDVIVNPMDETLPPATTPGTPWDNRPAPPAAPVSHIPASAASRQAVMDALLDKVDIDKLAARHKERQS